MTSLMHTLHIGTLATWLSVAGFGTVAVVMPDPQRPAPAAKDHADTRWDVQEITLGAETSPATEETPSATSDPTVAETLPAPPELPDLTETEPLPALPDLTPGAAAEPQNPAPEPPKPEPRRKARGSEGVRAAASSAAHASGARASGPNNPGGRAGMSDAARIAGGRMPSPSYPPVARSKGQAGTVVIEFTVDSSGSVITATAISPSPWPLLNNEAVHTVRHWSFPPGGGVMKLQRPIVFQLR